MRIPQHKFLLHFKDPLIEKDFRGQHESFLQNSLRSGLILSLFLWLAAIGLIYVIDPTNFRSVALSIGLTICPLYVFLIITTFSNKFLGLFHLFSAVSNLAAGLIVIHVGSIIDEGAYPTNIALVWFMFFSLYMYRLRLIMGFTVPFLYMLAFQINITWYSDVSNAEYGFMTFFSWLTFVSALIGGYSTEKMDRKMYLLKKTISDQKDMISNEKKKSDGLLLNILPQHIAETLKEDSSTIAKHHEQVTVLFADIVGFTTLSENLSAKELVELLNKIFSAFDRLVNKFGLEKIKTIGDAYMVAGGLKSDMNQATDLAQLGLEMQEYIGTDPEILKRNLRIRIGIHIGPAVAGVIGLVKFSYDLWGDTVNTASRMESHGETGKIHVSESVVKELDEFYVFEKRPLISIKGKGEMQTYFLLEKKNKNIRAAAKPKLH